MPNRTFAVVLMCVSICFFLFTAVFPVGAEQAAEEPVVIEEETVFDETDVYEADAQEPVEDEFDAEGMGIDEMPEVELSADESLADEVDEVISFAGETDYATQETDPDMEAAGDFEPGFYYTVKKGDTLWDLSQKFYDSEWVWPATWAQNKDIKNPHRIYPGQRIRLYQRTAALKQPEPL